MDGILALGHFCETHGPCVILCTQRCDVNPKQGPHSLTVPWCEACQSIDLQQALLSRDEKGQYITTRTPLQQDLAFLLKQATVRSLSCEEETNKDGSVLYFGDNERGHVFSHTFALQDSLARGFHRRYCIILLMRDKVHLLNSWPFLVKHVKKIAEDLKTQAANVNNIEQEKQSQRSIRQAQMSPSSQIRSLSQLTGQPAVYAHLHLWFCWLFSTQITIEIVKTPIEFKPPNPSQFLRALYFDMGENIFSNVLYCVLTGFELICSDNNILEAFYSVLPAKCKSLNNKKCFINRGASWFVDFNENLPLNLPSLLVNIVRAVKDVALPDLALKHQISALILHWKNNVNAICFCENLHVGLLQVLNIKSCDLPLIEYWLVCLVNNREKCGNVMGNLQRILIKEK